MRPLLCLLFLLTCFAHAQDSRDTYGKTQAQILEMGMDKWTDFFTSKAGNSTATMTESAEIYGEVAKGRNDKLMAQKVEPRLKAKVLRLRKLMRDFASSSVDVAYCESGGGTMYNTMWAAVTGVVEDSLYQLISKSGPKPKPMVVSKVTRQLARIQRQIEDMHRDKDNLDFFKYDDARKALTAMRTNYASIVEIAKTMNRSDSDRMLGFCFREALNGDINGERD